MIRFFSSNVNFSIGDFIRGLQYKKAVRKANMLAAERHCKHLVISVGGTLRVIAKRDLDSLVKMRYFRKGIKLSDIEKKALYVTL